MAIIVSAKIEPFVPRWACTSGYVEYCPATYPSDEDSLRLVLDQTRISVDVRLLLISHVGCYSSLGPSLQDKQGTPSPFAAALPPLAPAESKRPTPPHPVTLKVGSRADAGANASHLLLGPACKAFASPIHTRTHTRTRCRPIIWHYWLRTQEYELMLTVLGPRSSTVYHRRMMFRLWYGPAVIVCGVSHILSRCNAA
jgi:hypothetical protein